jgi:Uri superfamily endonuclease
MIDPATLPAEPGAYALRIHLARPARLTVGALGPVRLAAGAYVYAGSAFGPGGIRARVGRHLRAAKRPHWHIDYLTARGRIVEVMAFPDACECDVLAAALAAKGASVPAPGFGATDCRRCRSHLAAWPDGLTLAEIYSAASFSGT